MADLDSNIYGCWMGKSIGGTLGLPVEGQLGPLSLTYYDPVPTLAPPNDDLELQLVWLDLVENSNGRLLAEDFGRAWIRHIHYMWDEYGRCRWNLRRGVPATAAGTFENWFESGMGSPIRSEIWACLFPGDPESAGYYGGLDASLDHGVEGIAGEVFLAAMQSLILGGQSVPDALEQSRRMIPASSETAHVLALITDEYQHGIDLWESRRRLLRVHHHENFTHAPINVGLAVWALLHGKGDFEKSILLSTNAGYDTDSSTATVGATLGLTLGLEGLPSRWKDPIGDGVYLGPGIRNLSNTPMTLKELTERVVILQGKLERRILAEIPWEGSESPKLEDLKGTIDIHPLDGTQPVAWANGELPEEAKAAGGAQWSWEVGEDCERKVVFLAGEGGCLCIDNGAVLSVPPGLPYVPATHRAPNGCMKSIPLEAGRHTARVELDSNSSNQKVSVLLVYPDLHISPWSHDDLPDRAVLI